MSDGKKPTGKFEFSGAGFSVGAPVAGESAGAIQTGLEKLAIDKKKSKNQDDDEDDGDDEDEDDDDEIQRIPKCVLKRVAAVRKLHSTYEELDAKYKEERLVLEKKYLALKAPYYETRDQLVAGDVEPVTEENSDNPDVASTIEAVGATGDEDDIDVKGIPGFWLQVLSNHPSIGELITEDDMAALKHMTNIKCEYDETFTSFTLFFYFEENDFFSNTVLKKKYTVTPDLLDEKSPALTDNEGSEINWKSSAKNLCMKETKKKQRAKSGKNKGQVRTVVQQEPKPSFFHYFGNPKTEEEEEEDEENEEEEQIKLSMEEDYDVGHCIRTSVIPEAILWFTGEAVDDDDDLDFEGESDEDGDDDDDDEDDDDDDDESEEEEAPKKGKGGAKPKKGGNNNNSNKGKRPAAGGGFTGVGTDPAAGGGGGEGAGTGEQPECKQN